MKHSFFVSGIGTDAGKTVVSAVLVKALMAEYWKPVQSGELDNTDTMKVQRLTTLPDHHFHAEKYRLTQPLSPHASAEIDGVSIQPELIQLPETTRNLIVEGAGGLMVPLTTNFMVIDLIAQLNIPVILVSAYYLGSINHTLLSAEALQKRNIPIKGVIFNGNEVKSTREVIESYTGLKTLYHLPYSENLTSQFIDNHARQLAQQFA